MALFGSSLPESFLGVDISASGVKVVEVAQQAGKTTLKTYGYADFPASALVADPLENPGKTAELLKKVMASADVKAKKAIAGIGMQHVFSSIITVPFLPDKELLPHVQTQAQKLVSQPLAEMQLDWKVLNRAEAEKEKAKSLRVLVSGTAKRVVQQYLTLFKQAGLELTSLEPDVFALIRSLLGKDLGSVMLVDMGALRTHVAVIERGVPVLQRVLGYGGLHITESLAKTLGAPLDEAESVKRDYYMQKAQQLPKALEAALQPLLHDIGYIFRQYNDEQTASGNHATEKIILTGGAMNIPALTDFVARNLDVNVYRGDPWARVAVPQALLPVLDEIGTRFGVAVGLVLKE